MSLNKENLALRLKRTKKISGRPRKERPVPKEANVRWSMDFVSDALLDGRRFRILNIVDDATRECVATEVARSCPSLRVIRCLARALDARGAPGSIVMDNGTEFTARAMDQWAASHNVMLDFTRPGHPIDNAFIESYNGKFRDECLNQHWFESMSEARSIIEAWREEYNHQRPHSSLNYQTPVEYAQTLG